MGDRSDDSGTVAAQLALIGEITTLLTAERLLHWLYGGWGIDFLIGTITRAHGDIDFVVWAADADRLCALLATHGYEQRPTRYPEEGRIFVKRGQTVEITFIARTATGHIVTPGRWTAWPWPDHAFAAVVGALQTIVCPVVSAAAQLDAKEHIQDYAPGSAPRAVDRADIARLRALVGEYKTG